MQNNTFLTLFVGQTIVKLSEVDSTNTYVKELLSNSKPLLDGTVIMAGHQFAGKGQNNNVWESKPGENLTFSIYLNSSFLPLNQQFELNKVVCLGLIDCLKPIIGDECKIKWPNDIYYQDKKIGGVLIENVTKGYQLKDSIIGIGLNINQKDFGLLNQRASSLSKILHQDYDLDKLLAQICSSIEKRYLQLKAGKLTLLHDDYLKALYRINELHHYHIKSQTIKATIKGITTTGRLTLQEQDGKLIDLDLKEVKFIFD
ncbi:biotin--[acetyl-CoA-carboxylase] ligase [Pedobacter psychrophilus]|uniref:Biotin--[acetyl-CoA-carboxylase] ligase n=1 Tax=Pedobacter psychrophilus TaxID=1826909 RepID=A0A179DBG8_9SPHI|nr:biotin--[acetyl-CoA-carboxylase] ligase [Pedobacter psychrophilus]OAQ38395.1 biotin--[acetyl-CoA-carboxylase] ligase [Pedobacter psychrophilus]